MFSLVIISIMILGFSNIILNTNNKSKYEELNIAYDKYLQNKNISSSNIVFNEHK